MKFWPPAPVTAGVSFYSVFENDYLANSFNPNESADPDESSKGGRFHPFINANGNRVPTKYLADHPNGAFSEVIMRDDSTDKKVSTSDIKKYSIATIRFERNLELVDLSHTSLGGALNDQLSAGKSAYVKLRSLAASIYDLETKADGLVWDGKQLGIEGMRCMVLFGDRVSGSDMDVLNDYRLTKEEGLEMLRRCAVHRGFNLSAKYAVA